MKDKRKRLYIIYLTALAVFCTAELCARLWYFNVPPQTSEQLLAYQLRKIDTLPPKCTILVGDSSLGNSVDAKLLSELMGSCYVNLALSGDFITVGDYHLTRRAAAKTKLTKVIICHTWDIWYRNSNPDILKLMDRKFTPYGIESISFRLSRNCALAKQNSFYHKLLLRKKLGIIPTLPSKNMHQQQSKIASTIESCDYVPQGPKLDLTQLAPKDKKEGIFTVSTAVDQWFDKTLAFCWDHDIEVNFVTGPLFEPYTRSNKKYFRDIATYLQEKKRQYPNLNIISVTPEPINKYQIGDSIDHVSLDSKKQFTSLLAEKLKKSSTKL